MSQSTHESINNLISDILSLNLSDLLYQKHRISTLVNRIRILGNLIEDIPITYLDLIQTTLEEIKSYILLFSSNSQSLINHIIIYGSDEEQFIKWGERIQHCIGSRVVVGMFDEKLDLNDFKSDVEELRKSLVEITRLALALDARAIMGMEMDTDKDKSEVKEIDTKKDDNKNIIKNNEPKWLLKTLESLLTHQSQIRSTYQTKTSPSTSLQIDVKKIKYESIIGRGGFGTVWKARFKGEYVAVKKIPLNSLTKQSAAALKAEAEIMKRLAHPRIVGCFGIFEHKDNQCILMELMQSGSLHDYICERTCPEGWRLREEIGLDICSGMSYLHKLNVIHRDLKLANVVLDEYLRAKITDFGLSVVKSTAMTSIQGVEMGTTEYMAPECFGFSPIFSTKSDVYAFSIILWEMCHWKLAYQGVRPPEIRDGVRAKERLPINEDIPQFLNSIISASWDANPKVRPEFANISKRLESDIIVLQCSVPVVFTGPVTMVKSTNDQGDRGELGYTGLGNMKFYEEQQGPGQSQIESEQVSAINKTWQDKSTVPKKGMVQKFRLLSTKKKMLVLAVGIFILAVIVGISVAVSLTGSNRNSNDLAETTNVAFTTSTPDTPNLSSIIRNPATSSGTVSTSSKSSSSNPPSITPGQLGGGSTSPTTSPSNPPSITPGQLGGGSTSSTTSQSNPPSITPGQLGGGSTSSTTSSSAAPTSKNLVVSTVAGAGSPGYFDSQGPSALFNGPNGIVTDSADNLYIVDTYNSRIRKYSSGLVTTYASGFNAPKGIAIDPSGNLFVTDTNNHCIRKVTTAGVILTFAGSGIANSADGNGTMASFNHPYGITIDSLQNLYVADYNNNLIRKITPLGVVTTIAGSGKGSFADGVGISASFNLPSGIAVDSIGNLFVADSGNNRIRRISLDYSVSTLAGSGVQGSTDGSGSFATFHFPEAITIDSSGNLIVADTNNNLIRSVTQAGVVTTLAGTGVYGLNDGQANYASFAYPRGVVVGPTGNIYLSNSGTNVIRKISS